MTARDDAREYLSYCAGANSVRVESILTALLAEHEALLARVEAAPLGTVTSFDTSGAWIVAKDELEAVYEPLKGQTVRLLRVG